MKNTGIVIALLVFVVLVFIAIGQRGGGKKSSEASAPGMSKVEKDKVTKIEVTLPPAKKTGDDAPAEAGPRKLVLEKDGDAWKVYDPAQADKKFTADETQVKSALDAVGELGFGDLISNKADKLAGYEIDDAQGHAVKVSTASGPALDVVFGRSAKGGGATVRLAGSNDVHIAKGRLGAVLKRDITGWRRKSVLDVKAEDIVRVATTLADGRAFVVEAGAQAGADEKPEWSLVEPATLPAGFRLDKAQLSRAAASVAGLRAQDFSEASDDEAGLSGAHAVVEAKTKDGKTLKIHLGKEDDKKRVFARVDGDPQLYLLPSYNAKQLMKSVDDLRDLAMFDGTADGVEKVAFTGSTKVVVQKDGEVWKLVEPKAVPEGFDVEQIGTQVAALLRTKATRLAADAPPSAVSAKPGPVVEVVMKGGKKQTLRFGAPVPVDDPAASKGTEPREYFVKGGVDDLTYVLPAFTRTRYEKPAELFKAPAQPQGFGGPGARPGQIPGLEKLPPDVRKKLEEQLQKGDLPVK